jgi:hypothetical protein
MYLRLHLPPSQPPADGTADQKHSHRLHGIHCTCPTNQNRDAVAHAVSTAVTAAHSNLAFQSLIIHLSFLGVVSLCQKPPHVGYRLRYVVRQGDHIYGVVYGFRLLRFGYACLVEYEAGSVG